MNYLKNENHVVIHGWMINELALNGLPLMIFAIIYGFTQTDDQYFTGSFNYLSAWTGKTRRSCINAVNTLIENGYITKELYQDSKGVSRVKYSTMLRDSEKISLSSEKTSLGVVKNFHYINNEYNNINNINNNKKEIHKEKRNDLFSLFWEEYPKKVSKAKALLEWQKIAPTAQLCQVIIEAVKNNKRYNQQWTRDAGQYIPYPTTWLHQRRWEDELSMPKKQEIQERYEVEL